MGKEINDSGLLESLVEDIREFTEGMEASDGEWGYCLRKVRETLGRRRVWDAAPEIFGCEDLDDLYGPP